MILLKHKEGDYQNKTINSNLDKSRIIRIEELLSYVGDISFNEPRELFIHTVDKKSLNTQNTVTPSIKNCNKEIDINTNLNEWYWRPEQGLAFEKSMNLNPKYIKSKNKGNT